MPYHPAASSTCRRLPVPLSNPPPGPPRPPEPPINESPHPVVEPPDGFEHQPLEDRAQILRAMVEHSSDALLVSSKDDDDPMTRVCFVNEAFTELLGFELGDLDGRSPGELVGPETDLDTLRRIEAGLRRGEVVTTELILADRDGRPTRVEATYRLIETSSGVSWSLARFRDRVRPPRGGGCAAPQRGVGRGVGAGELRSGHGGRHRRDHPIRQSGVAGGPRL